MKKIFNNEILTMTSEEITEMEQMKNQIPSLVPSFEERVRALEEESRKVRNALELLLHGAAK